MTSGGGYWNWSTYGFEAGGMHHTGMHSCFQLQIVRTRVSLSCVRLCWTNQAAAGRGSLRTATTWRATAREPAHSAERITKYSRVSIWTVSLKAQHKDFYRRTIEIPQRTRVFTCISSRQKRKLDVSVKFCFFSCWWIRLYIFYRYYSVIILFSDISKYCNNLSTFEI